jgi:hypothetical protein
MTTVIQVTFDSILKGEGAQGVNVFWKFGGSMQRRYIDTIPPN